MMPRVVEVIPVPQYRLRVAFDDGVAGTIDLSGELDGEVFQPLRDEAVFRQVTVDEFGAVCCPNGPDRPLINLCGSNRTASRSPVIFHRNRVARTADRMAL